MLGESMDLDEENLIIKKIEVEFNKKMIFSILLVTFLVIIFTGCLTYVLSDSLYTVFLSLVTGATLGFLLNFLIISSQKFVKNVDVHISCDEESIVDLHTIMKIE